MTPQSSEKSTECYQKLQPERVLETISQLQRRIEERFPQAGLVGVCKELLLITRDAQKTAAAIARPMWGLRIVIYLIVAGILSMAVYSFSYLEWKTERPDLAEFITIMEAAFNDLVLVGAAILFLITVEVRVKRRRALTAIHRLRSIAHIIDMHQLTKDPERVLHSEHWNDTASSPRRMYTQFELGRYLDYCTEMLSLTGKVAAIYAEEFPDAQSVGAVNELESLTTGLSRKIWQKIMILHTDRELSGNLSSDPDPPLSPVAEPATTSADEKKTDTPA